MTLEHGGNTKNRVRRARKDKMDVRQDKVNEGVRQIKEKFVEQRKIIPLQAKTENQRIALKAFTEHQCVILTNHSGVGKTELMCWWACKQWLEGKVDNIVITRPYKHIGADYGATKGNDAEKLLPFCMSMLMKLKKYLGIGILKNNFKLDGFESFFMESSGIQIVAAEKIQGLSFSDKTIILADEQQNMTIPQMKSLMTRAEEGCQLILSGDPQQTALSGVNGLQFITEVFDKYPTEYAKVVRFTRDDVVRGGLTGHLVRAFEDMGNVW